MLTVCLVIFVKIRTQYSFENGWIMSHVYISPSRDQWSSNYSGNLNLIFKKPNLKKKSQGRTIYTVPKCSTLVSNQEPDIARMRFKFNLTGSMRHVIDPASYFSISKFLIEVDVPNFYCWFQPKYSRI